ncbi:hypothetical protein SDC9_28500 [bioreactor metagenome]|uniref:CBS domain-containing protein n=1 Tax=bioreactor metagenome TaxID=1076179 RepID=A0A644UV08_9ZZZZ|nr:CBS domain-containing protein [Desulfovibrio desulfuricans]MEA4991702.1 CBS domain-containing protein [Desulfovibrio desulfuricans]
MNIEELDKFVAELKDNDEAVKKITPRQLIEAFGWNRRTENCQRDVDQYLQEKNLELEPGYVESWIDSTIVLKHKKKAKAKCESDPVKKVVLLSAANTKPITVTNDTQLSTAVTTMLHNDFSQLPVTSGGKNVLGYISWETIGSGLALGEKSKLVSGYVDKNISLISKDTPLLEAIKIVGERTFVVVQDVDKTLCGIITSSDISFQFFNMTEPFLLLDQIENQIRRMLNGKILEEDIKRLRTEQGKGCPESIDDLNFGEYILLLQREKNWTNVGLPIDKDLFLKKLDEIRKIRNDVMHFDPDGISSGQLEELRKIVNLINKIFSMKKREAIGVEKK